MITRSGLGDMEKAQYTGYAATAATTGVAIAAPLIGGAAVAGPIGIAIGGAALLATMLFMRKNPMEKTESSKLADSIENEMKANLAMWQQVEKTDANKEIALSNFLYYWNIFESQVVQFGKAGQRGLEERSRGGKYDWWKYYYDPIEQTPTDTFGEANTLTQLTQAFDWTKLAIPGFLVLGAMMIGEKK